MNQQKKSLMWKIIFLIVVVFGCLLICNALQPFNTMVFALGLILVIAGLIVQVALAVIPVFKRIKERKAEDNAGFQK